MLKQLIPAVKATLVIAFMTGIAFPLVMTLITQGLFPQESHGSLVKNERGEVIGSQLIGQPFSKPEYFHPRPSSAGSGYAGEASAGSNLGPTSSKLINGIEDDPKTKDADESFAGIKQLSQKYRLDNRLSAKDKVPVDAVTRSGSGLDPHISYANALIQAHRVASARSKSFDEIKPLVDKELEQRQFGLFGEPRVNVLMLNLALDGRK